MLAVLGQFSPPKNVGSNLGTPSCLPPLLYRHTKTPTSGIPEDWYCQQGQMKWDLGGPRAQRVKINRPDVWICECGCGSDLRGCRVNV